MYLSEHENELPDCYVEVKNVSLLSQDGVGLFPDAVTVRGQKHLEELMLVRQLGYRAVMLFCVQHSGIEKLMPADQIDPVYGALLRKAAAEGVEILAYAARFELELSQVELIGPAGNFRELSLPPRKPLAASGSILQSLSAVPDFEFNGMKGFAFARADHALPTVDLKQCAVGSTTDEGAIVFQKPILFPFQRGPEVRAAVVVEMQLFILLYGKKKRPAHLKTL